MSEAFDLKRLERLRGALARLRSTHLATMEDYVSADRRGFRHQMQQKKTTPSLASTATCVASLVAANEWKAKVKDKEGGFSLFSETSEIASYLVTQNTSAELPEDNPFSLSFVAEGILDLADAVSNYKGEQEHLKHIRDVITPKLYAEIEKDEEKNPQGTITIWEYPASAYLTQLAHRVILRVGCADEKLNTYVHRWSRDEINKQVALLTAKSRVADPMQMAYALILAVTTVPDDRTSPEDKEIFGHALSLFFASQNDDGSWPLSRPMFHYRKVGNAYCFEYELLTQLLQCEPLQLELLGYLDNFDRAVGLLRRTKFDLDAKPEVKRVGWASGHHPQVKGPESWSTASVYHFAHALDRLVAEAVRRELFRELRTPYKGPPGKPTTPPEDGTLGDFAPAFLDAHLHSPEAEDGSLRTTLAKRFVFPLARQAINVAKGRSFTDETPMSAILFGPPGPPRLNSPRPFATISTGRCLRWIPLTSCKRGSTASKQWQTSFSVCYSWRSRSWFC